jgi:hypothetical protein
MAMVAALVAPAQAQITQACNYYTEDVKHADGGHGDKLVSLGKVD